MIGSSRALRVFAYAGPVDMRKSYEGLGALVRNELGRDLLSGELYLFTNRRRTRAKVLLFDGTGLCIYMKRLDKGRFAKLWRDEGRGSHRALSMTMSELSLFLEGSELVGRRALSPPAITQEDLAVAMPM
jgi:transposase